MKLPALLPLAAAALVAIPAFGQAPGVPIEGGGPIEQNQEILKQAGELKAAGKLLNREKVFDLLKSPDKSEVEVIAPHTEKLSPQDVAVRARKGFVRIGWYYLCPRCDHWHLGLAGGYAVDRKGTVATCDHCVRTDREMREGYLVAVDDNEKVYAVNRVLASSEELDAALLQIEGSELEPLPLQDQIVPGDAAFLYSEPFGHAGYFSTGMVNRFYWKSGDAGDAMKLEDAARLRLNVTTDWAPGSSGAAVIDACGNAIGHVSRIETRGGEAKGKEASQTMITFREAVPARGVLLLLKSLKD
ncbi:serine protease [Haloferula sp. BvORR071]|uniref:S1 family peptidase n=1 Tax=Haloferula sp. BvORR071 TaxID=1396141 RepID=UPI00054F388F|nr:serine protease [Haloferula sp. BvORR071]